MTITVDLSKLPESYDQSRVAVIKQRLAEAACSMLGSGEGQTLDAFARDDRSPVRHLLVSDLVIPLPAGVMTIGRQPDCGLHLSDDLGVSRLHASLTVHASDGRVTLRDADSVNGTLVNGQRVTEETNLCSGDVVEIGKFRLELI